MVDKIKVLRSPTTGNLIATTTAADLGEIGANLPDHKIFVRDATGAPVTVGEKVLPYSATRRYQIDDLAIDSNVLYRRTAAPTTPGAFTPASWQAIGSAVALTGAVVVDPTTTARNTVTPTAAVATPLTLKPFAGQSASLLDVNGTKHDVRGLPVGRYGEVAYLVSQTTHPFSAVGQPAAYVHPNWVLAKAGDATLAVRALVHEIIDANNVILQHAGQIKSLNAAASFVGGAITAGATYFLSDTAGKMSSTPSASGAQACLLALTTTTGLLLFANASGAAIVSRAPNAQAQTIFEPLSIRNTTGANGLTVTPNSQSITSIGGTPVSLSFQNDGILAVGGQLNVSSAIVTTGDLTVTNTTPIFYIKESDLAAGNTGRWRMYSSADTFYFQHSLTGEFTTSTTIFSVSGSTALISFPSAVGPSFFVSPTFLPPVADADNQVAATIGIARSWSFVQKGVGTAADLELSANVAGDKGFWVLDSVRTKGFRFAPYTGKISSIGVAINLAADLNVGVNLAQEFASPEFNVRASSTATTAALSVGSGATAAANWGIFFSGTSSYLQFRWLNVVKAYFDTAGDLFAEGSIYSDVGFRARSDSNPSYYMMDAAGNEVALIYSLSTDDSLLMRLRTAGVTRAQLRMYTNGDWEQFGSWTGIAFTNIGSAAVNDLSHHIDLYGGIYGFSVTGSRLNLVATSSANVQVVHGSAVVALFDALDTGTAGNATVMTLIKGDARYLNASNLNQGTVPVARLPTIPMSKLETGSNAATWVGNAYGDLSSGAIGTVASYLGPGDGHTSGSNYSGSSLKRPNFKVNVNTTNLDISYNDGPGGTWKAMTSGTAASDERCLSVFMRIA